MSESRSDEAAESRSDQAALAGLFVIMGAGLAGGASAVAYAMWTQGGAYVVLVWMGIALGGLMGLAGLVDLACLTFGQKPTAVRALAWAIAHANEPLDRDPSAR